jgi:hypothetical protein
LLRYIPNISIFLFLGINGSFHSLNASKLTHLSHSLVPGTPHTMHITPNLLPHPNINSNSILKIHFDYPPHDPRPRLEAIAVADTAVSFCGGPE